MHSTVDRKLCFRLLLQFFLACSAAAPGPALAQHTDFSSGLNSETPCLVDRNAGELRMLAHVQPEAFDGGWIGMARYHAVVWKDGHSASRALFASQIHDAAFHDSLLALGATPGNNLTQNAWDKRKDRNHPAPDVRVEGTRFSLHVWWDGLAEPVPLHQLFADASEENFDLRFGGNKALIPNWHSGCIVCLYSCPGGKIGNARFTVRDYVDKRADFSLDKEQIARIPENVVLIFRIEK